MNAAFFFRIMSRSPEYRCLKFIGHFDNTRNLILQRNVLTALLLLSLVLLAAARPQDFDDEDDHEGQEADDRKGSY